MKLKKITIHKYKSFETEQKFDLEDDITILVGMNKSGKTSALEAIAKLVIFKMTKVLSLIPRMIIHEKIRNEWKRMVRIRKPLLVSMK